MTIDFESLSGNPNIPAPGHVKFFSRNDVLFFMDDTGAVFSMAGGVARVIVADINDPSAELNLISGAASGDLIIAIQINLSGDDVYTVYAWDSTPNGAEVVPFSVDGLSGGIWIAMAGRFQNQSIETIKDQNYIRFFFQQIGDLKSPTTYHGSIAHLHAVGDPVNHGTLNYAHADNWRMLKDHNDDDEVTLTPAATVDINFGKLGTTANVYQSLTLDQDTTLTESNAIGGVRRFLRVASGTPGQTLTFPANWDVFGSYNTNGAVNLIIVDCVSPSVQELRGGGSPPAAAYIAFIVQDIAGDVTGPGTATDEAVARYDLTTGKLIQNSVVLIDDAGNITTPGLLNSVDVTAHKVRHQLAGPDQINVAGLSGLLGDAQTPLAHTIVEHDTLATGAQLTTLSAGPASNADGLHFHAIPFDVISAGLSSGIVDGGILTVGAPNTTFSVSDGFGYIADHVTSPSSPTLTKVVWSGLSNLTVDDLATQLITFVSMNAAGAVIQQSGRWTPAQYRTLIPLGVLVHVNNLNLDTTNNSQHPAIDAAAQVADVLNGIGFVNVGNDANRFFPTGATLNISKTVGAILAHGSNWDIDPLNPHTRTLSALTALTFQYRFQDGSNGATGIAINPNIWDDGGVSTATPAGKYTIQRIYSFISNNVKIQPGQFLYDSIEEAKAQLQQEGWITEPSLIANGLLRGLLIVRQGTTDLTSGDALFLEATPFGDVFGVAQLDVSTLQSGYDFSSAPDILTDATNGALTLQRGSAADTDDVFEIQNGAGTRTFAVRGDGLIDAGTIPHAQVTSLGIDDHHARDHAAAHAAAATDALLVESLGTASSDTSNVARPNGSGGLTMSDLPHVDLTGLGADDHTQYILATGTRAFSGVVSGITPTIGAHLVTKDYVDGIATGTEWQDSVFDRDLTAPPGSPTTGDRYIVATGGTGLWLTHDDEIAQWNGSAWDFTVQTLGMVVGVDDELRNVRWNGSSWGFFGTTIDHGNLAGVGDDDHPQYHDGSLAYTGALNMGAFAITNVGNVDGRDVSADGGILDGHVASTTNPHATDIGNLGAGTLAELNAILTGSTLIADTRDLIAGAGLTGGGTLAADRTFTVGAHADASIVVAADTVQVGVLATDAQHGVRGGGTQHADVIAGGASGFMDGARATKLDGLESASSLYSFNFLTATTATDPGSGNFKFDNSTVASVTAIYFDDLAASGIDFSAVFGSLVVGSEITFEQVDDHSKAAIFEITSITDNTGWWTLGVTYRDDVGSLFTAAAECSFALHSGIVIKEWTQNIGYSSVDDSYRIRGVASNGSANITFRVPFDFVSLISLEIIGKADGDAVAVSIDLSSDYGAVGQSTTTHSETDTTTTYNFTSGIQTATDISGVFSSLAAGDSCGLFWDNKSIGVALALLQTRIVYRAG